MECLVCKSTDIKVDYIKKNMFNYNKCNKCGLFMLNNIPADLNRYYGEGYFTGDVSLDGYVDYEKEKEQSAETFQKYLNIIKKHKPEKGDFFEIGCATGFFLNMAKSEGWKTSGIDVSEYAVKRANEKGLTVAKKTLTEFTTNSQQFDVIALLDTVEHLTTPSEDFGIISSMLKDGGIVAFSTPDSGSLWAKIWNKKWHAFVPPQHINLFSQKNITTLLEKHNLKVIYVGHYGKSFTLPYIFRLLKTWTNLQFFGSLANFCGSNSLKKISIPINLGDTMFVLAKKV